MLCIIDLAALCQGEGLRRSPAHRGAVPLYEGLKSQFQMVAFSREHREVTDWWLKKERLPEWALTKVWDPDVWQDYDAWLAHEISGFLAWGWEIAVYIDNDVRRLGTVHDLHVATMRLVYPEHGPGFFDPDKAPRAWADVSATVGESLGGNNGPG